MNTYKTVLEIVADGSATYEERRSQELIVRSKLFGGTDKAKGAPSKGGGQATEVDNSGDEKRRHQAINDIP
jgi:hypothetical protein